MESLNDYISKQINEEVEIVKKGEPYECLIIKWKNKDEGYKCCRIIIKLSKILQFKDKFNEIKHPRLAGALRNTVEFYSRENGWINIYGSEISEGSVKFTEDSDFDRMIKRNDEILKEGAKNIKRIYYSKIDWDEILKNILHEPR